VAVSGGNATAARLCALLEEAGFGEIVADAEPGALSDRVPAVVAAVSESGFGALSAWNDFSLEHDVPFLPVAIEDLVAYVGPLVVPHQTACFECFLRRRYSNLDEAEARRPVELRGGGTPVVGLHPGICAVAAGAAALELSKLFLPWHGVQQAGHLLTFNLLAGRSGRHRVLKLPRCPACSSLHARQPVAAASSRLSDDGV
jgi:bacteriocin biosynthesis cyclodehydratase domain-containing protein